MSESTRTRALCRVLEGHGSMIYPLVGSQYTPPGWPDRYVCHQLWRGFLEFKKDDYGLEPLQRRILCDLRRRGENAWCCRFAVPGGKLWPLLIEHPDTDEVVAECTRALELLQDLAELARAGR